MKRSNFSAILVGAITTLFFLSCNNEEKNSNASTDTTNASTSATTPATTAPANTIITTPQNMTVVMHKVANYEKWKPFYDGHDTARVSHGLHSYVIGRGLTDTNTVLVAMKTDNVDKAKAFANDASVKKVMHQSGVVGAPTINYYTMVWQDTATISSAIRSRTTFTVKDWDVWVKNFELADAKQERTDNGIQTRAYGHDVNDNKKVTLVTALTDTAKAFAYYKSDALKKRRAAGGVIGEPKRFLYTVVQRY
jgi:hypothetical protein